MERIGTLCDGGPERFSPYCNGLPFGLYSQCKSCVVFLLERDPGIDAEEKISNEKIL
jgi:hypothetical protein